jgi:uncharacterized protein YabE (DUF348 family)
MLAVLLVALFTTSAIAAGYLNTLTPIWLRVDGRPERRLFTHQATVSALLMDLGFTLRPEDRVVPPDPDTLLVRGMTVAVGGARGVYAHADGHDALFYTLQTTVEGVLQEARVSVMPYDEVEVAGSLLPSKGVQLNAPYSASDPEPTHVTIRRAVPFTINEDGQVTPLYTTAPTVGEALRRAGLTLYLADGVEPRLGERMQAGLAVTIDRSIPVTVIVDGRTLRTRTHRGRVDEVLADLGVVLTGQDYALPALDAPLGQEAAVKVVRVAERFVIEQEPIPFEAVWQSDPALEIDYQRVIQDGARGILERRIRVRYEDGNEIARAVDGEYVAIPPTTKVMGYGTQIVVRTLETPSGPVEYWRKIRVLATSYSASTAGTPRTSPWYGRTRTGMTMRFGIVAVDPRLINLRTNVYVPNYGVGIAGDTGGAIRGRRIDLGYDDDNLVLWYRWVDVYLLTPVPPADQINYIIP